jgi:hypothetical protein
MYTLSVCSLGVECSLTIQVGSTQHRQRTFERLDCVPSFSLRLLWSTVSAKTCSRGDSTPRCGNFFIGYQIMILQGGMASPMRCRRTNFSCICGCFQWDWHLLETRGSAHLRNPTLIWSLHLPNQLLYYQVKVAILSSVLSLTYSEEDAQATYNRNIPISSCQLRW